VYINRGWLLMIYTSKIMNGNQKQFECVCNMVQLLLVACLG